MKSYPQYKESGSEIIKQIPMHWVIAPLKFIGKIILGKMLTPEDKGGYTEKPYLRAKNIGWETVDAEDIKTMWLSAYELGQYRLEQNDLLISEGGEVGRTAIWNSELDECYIQNSVHKVTIHQEHNPRYYLYHSQVFGKTGYYDSIVNRVSIAHLTGEKLKDIRFVVPPLSEQQAVADFLDCKTAQIDALIEKKQRQIDLLQEQRTALINHAVTKGLNPDAPMKYSGVEWLGEIPSHWEVKRVKHLVQRKRNAIKTGPFGSQLTNADMMGTDVKVYNQRSVIDNDFVNGENHVSLEKFQQLKEFEIFAGDILITTRGTIGRCAIFPENAEKGILHPCLIRLQLDEKLILKEYLIWFIQDSVLFQQSIFFESNATTIDVIYSGTMKQVLVPVPPIEEQFEIIKYLSELKNKVQQANDRLEKEILLLQEYRTALISEAVTGKIDVREWKTVHE